MNATDMIAQVMAARTKARLILMFEIPGRDDVFTCYPPDETAKQKWLVKAKAKGWRQI